MRCATTLCWPTASAGRWSARAAMSPGCASPAGRRRHLRAAARRGQGVRRPAARSLRLGRLLRARHADLAQPLGHRTDAIVECREALALPSRRGRAVLLRRIEVLEGTARMDVRLRMRGDCGREPVRDLRRDPDGAWRGRAGTVDFAWHPGAAAHGDASELGLELDLAAGDRHELVLVLGEPIEPGDRWSETEAEWKRRVPELRSAAAPRDARHAVAVLARADPRIRRDGRRRNDGAT